MSMSKVKFTEADLAEICNALVVYQSKLTKAERKEQVEKIIEKVMSVEY